MTYQAHENGCPVQAGEDEIAMVMEPGKIIPSRCPLGDEGLARTHQTLMKKYYEQYCTVTHWKQYTLESGGFVTSHMRVRDAIWQMKERWIEKATFEIDT